MRKLQQRTGGIVGLLSPCVSRAVGEECHFTPSIFFLPGVFAAADFLNSGSHALTESPAHQRETRIPETPPAHVSYNSLGKYRDASSAFPSSFFISSYSSFSSSFATFRILICIAYFNCNIPQNSYYSWTLLILFLFFLQLLLLRHLQKIR